MSLRKRLVGLLSSLLGLTVFIDGVRFGRPDRTPTETSRT